MYNKVIGTIPIQDVTETISQKPWGNVFLPEIPYSAISPPPTYMFSLGSANVSHATTSEAGIHYNSGFDLFRWDNNFNSVDVDQYLAEPHNNHYRVYKIQPPHHHLTQYDQIFDSIPQPWQQIIRKSI